MQSVNQQVDAGYEADVMEQERPAPLVTERVSSMHAATGANDAPTRYELAAAFRRQGRGLTADTAWEQAKDFYRSSGHDWSRGLK